MERVKVHKPTSIGNNMDEMDEYRDSIEKRYHDRRSANRYIEGGRRKEDYKSPSVFCWGDLWLLIPLVLSGLCMLLLSGCTVIKKTLRGE